MSDCQILIGDALEILKSLPDETYHTCVTSPPYYGLRDYGHDQQIGIEKNPEEYVEKLRVIFNEVRRVLRNDGTLWLNIGDSYTGSGKGPAGNLGKKHNERNMSHTIASKNVPTNLKTKELMGIPWRVAFALQSDGWYLRQDIIWHKPNPMPESVKDRCTKAHEYIFLFSKRTKYYYDYMSIAEPAIYGLSGKDRRPHGIVRNRIYRYKSKLNELYKNKQIEMNFEDEVKSDNGLRNKRSVWTVKTKPYKGAHFAVFPPDLIRPCILAGSPVGGNVIDPFAGSGTTGEVAMQHNRNVTLIELNPKYKELITQRISSLNTKLEF